MTRIAAIAFAVCVAGPSVCAGREESPDADELRKLILETPKVSPDEKRSARLRAALEEHVAEFISEPRWSAYHEWRGISPSALSMTEPAEAIYALSLAYPYVSDELKPKVKEYLRREFTQNRPYATVDYPNVRKGARRNYHRIDEKDLNARGVGNIIPNRRVQLYPLYVYFYFSQSLGPCFSLRPP